MDEGSEERPIIRIGNEKQRPAVDHLALEAPLRIEVADEKGNRIDFGILMRTPGNDRNLVAGFLHSEGVVQRAPDIVSIEGNLGGLVVKLRGARAEGIRSRRTTIGTSCGICGRLETPTPFVDGCRELPPNPRVNHATLQAMVASMRNAQSIFSRTGGVHAAARFDARGSLLDIAEDVGRHNAMDALVGRSLLAESLPLDNQVVILSGRIAFEMAEKAIRAGVSVLCGVGAATTLAVDVARAHGMTLIDFLSEAGANVCSGRHRVEH